MKCDVRQISPSGRSQVEPKVSRLIELTKTNQESDRDVLDRMKSRFRIEKPGQKLESFANLDRTGSGILAFITNHGYLDNPTFRGMRQSLEKTFDEIYLMDLHGNSKKKEVSPDGSPDKNVFDIQQGVAVAIMVKYPKSVVSSQ
jgi:hypothetical protein